MSRGRYRGGPTKARLRIAFERPPLVAQARAKMRPQAAKGDALAACGRERRAVDARRRADVPPPRCALKRNDPGGADRFEAAADTGRARRRPAARTGVRAPPRRGAPQARRPPLGRRGPRRAGIRAREGGGLVRPARRCPERQSSPAAGGRAARAAAAGRRCGEHLSPRPPPSRRSSASVSATRGLRRASAGSTSRRIVVPRVDRLARCSSSSPYSMPRASTVGPQLHAPQDRGSGSRSARGFPWPHPRKDRAATRISSADRGSSWSDRPGCARSPSRRSEPCTAATSRCVLVAQGHGRAAGRAGAPPIGPSQTHGMLEATPAFCAGLSRRSRGRVSESAPRGRIVDVQCRRARSPRPRRGRDTRHQVEKHRGIGAAGQHQEEVLSRPENSLTRHEGGHAPFEAMARRIGTIHDDSSEGDDLVAASRPQRRGRGWSPTRTPGRRSSSGKAAGRRSRCRSTITSTALVRGARAASAPARRGHREGPGRHAPRARHRP